MDDLSRYKTYKIGEAARILGVKPYVLRFWESEFEQIEPLRKASGQRAYSEEHLRTIRRIQYLLHEKGLTIEGAKKQLAEDSRAGIMRDIESELLAIRAVLTGEETRTEVRDCAGTEGPEKCGPIESPTGADGPGASGTAAETGHLEAFPFSLIHPLDS